MSRYNLKLTTLSPIHIGTASGEIGPAEFFIKNDYVHITSEKYVVDSLSNHGLVDSFIEYFQENTQASLGEFLASLPSKQRNKIENEVTIRKVPLNGITRKVFRLRPHVTAGLDGIPYLPGSSIKGAFRNVLLYLLCRQNEEVLENILKKLPRAKSKEKQSFAKELDQKLLQEVKLPGIKQGPNTDWLKSLNISDAYPEKSECTELVPVKVASLTDDGYHFSSRNKRDIEVNVECISPGTAFNCDVIVDDFTKELFNRIDGGVFDFESLLNNLNKKFARLIEEDKQLFNSAGIQSMENRYEMLAKWGANLRLGWGSGLLTMTVDLLLSEKNRKDLRSAFYNKRNNPNFPQSRKVVMDKKSLIDTLGWIKLQWEKLE